MNFKRGIVLVLVILVIVIVAFSKAIINYLIEQSKNPTGLVGSTMTKIWNVTFEDMTNWGLSKINIDNEDYILDVGCGGGKTVYNLSNEVPNGKVYGIDISDESVKTSINENKKNIEEGKIEILKSDVAELPFENNYFNYVTAVQTHIYWNEIEKGFEEIYIVLKKDGQLLIICEKDKIEYHLKEEYKGNNNTKELLYSIGFNEVKIEETNKWILFNCKK